MKNTTKKIFAILHFGERQDIFILNKENGDSAPGNTSSLAHKSLI